MTTRPLTKWLSSGRAKGSRTVRADRRGLLRLESLETRTLLDGRPVVVGLDRLDDAAVGRLRVAIDFSEAMDAAFASDRSFYAVAAEDAPGLRVVSASYADSASQHRVTIVAETVDGGVLPPGNYNVRLQENRLRDISGETMVAPGDEVAVLLNDTNLVVTVGMDDSEIVELAAVTLGYRSEGIFIVDDFNGDEIPDLAAASRGRDHPDTNSVHGQIGILLGLGGGQFADPFSIPLDPNHAAESVRSADWDRDGDMDLVVTAYSPGQSDRAFGYVFLNDGDAKFTLAADMPFAVFQSGSFSGGWSPWHVVADVLPGGGPEIVMYQDGRSGFSGLSDREANLQILGKDPFLGYNRLLTIPLGVDGTPQTILAEDFDHDGRTDLVVATFIAGAIGGSDLLYVPGTVSGLGTPRLIPFDHLMGIVPRIGDLNGDGHLDLLIAHDYYSNSAGADTGGLLTTLLGDGAGHFTERDPVVLGRRGITLGELGDVDGDGRLDAILVHNWNDEGSANWPDTDGPNLIVYKGDASGGFEQLGPAIEIGSLAGSRIANLPATVTLTDIDGDGDKDVLVGGTWSGEIAALTNDGAGAFADSVPAGPNLGSHDEFQGFGIPGLVLADFNNDGETDFAKISSRFGNGGGTIEVFLGGGGGAFRQISSFNTNVTPSGDIRWLQAGDLDGDGWVDLVVGRWDAQKATVRPVVFLGRGDGRFGLPTIIDSGGYSANNGHIADVNGDGKADMIATLQDFSGSHYGVFFGDGTGRLIFNAQTVRKRQGSRSDPWLCVADFDGDGKLDLADAYSNNLQFYRGLGNGTFAAALESPASLRGFTLRAGDLNGDARPDLVAMGFITNTTGVIHTFLNDGTGRFVEKATIDTGGAPYDVGFGDYDGDGDADVVVGLSYWSTQAPRLKRLSNDGKGNLSIPKVVDVSGRMVQSVTAYDADAAVLAGTIAVSAPSTVQFASPTVTVDEAGGSVILTLTRSGSLALPAAVEYSVSGGTATAGQDYAALSGTIAFAAGLGTKTIAITVLNDALVEGAETLIVSLTNPQGLTLGQPSAATVTISDDDRPATLAFSAASYSVDEGGKTLTVTATRAGGITQGASVSYSTAPGSASAADFTPASGTLSFAPGETSKSFAIAIADDAESEGPESFTITLSGAAGSGVALGTPTTATVTILDDEGPGTFQFESPTYEAIEGGATLVVAVTRSGGTNRAGSVRYASIGGSAAGGLDYETVSGRLDFAAGESRKTFVIVVSDDALVEGAEAFTIVLSDPTGSGLSLGSPATVTVTLADDDQTPPPASVLEFASAVISAGEAAGTATITVRRSGSTVGSASVRYELAGGTATAAIDHLLVSGTLEFAPGQSARAFFLPITDDALDEPDETVVVRLTSPTGAGVSLGATTVATLTIIDDDLPAPPPPPVVVPPRVTSVEVVYFAKKISGLMVRFDKILDPGTAQDRTRYALQVLGRRPKSLAIQGAAYDPENRGVRLAVKGLAANQSLQLTIQGLRDSVGVELDGDRDGAAGGVAVISPVKVQSPPVPKAPPTGSGGKNFFEQGGFFRRQPRKVYRIKAISATRVDRAYVTGGNSGNLQDDVKGAMEYLRRRLIDARIEFSKGRVKIAQDDVVDGQVFELIRANEGQYAVGKKYVSFSARLRPLNGASGTFRDRFYIEGWFQPWLPTLSWTITKLDAYLETVNAGTFADISLQGTIKVR